MWDFSFFCRRKNRKKNTQAINHRTRFFNLTMFVCNHESTHKTISNRSRTIWYIHSTGIFIDQRRLSSINWVKSKQRKSIEINIMLYLNKILSIGIRCWFHSILFYFESYSWKLSWNSRRCINEKHRLIRNTPKEFIRILLNIFRFFFVSIEVFKPMNLFSSSMDTFRKRSISYANDDHRPTVVLVSNTSPTYIYSLLTEIFLQCSRFNQ